MNKVLYLTSAVSQKMFVDYLQNWRISPNLSNQNFHNKLIRAIAKFNDVDVISIRSINKNYKYSKLNKDREIIENISWLYPKVSINKASKFLFLNHRINQLIKQRNKADAIIVDTLNLSLLKAAIYLRKKYKIKVFGICSDNPNNISFTSKMYKKQLINLGQNLDGYIVLTEAINNLYNINHKPYIQIDGVSEEYYLNSKRIIEDEYIYFGGSLMKEYGVYNLIEAYKEMNLQKIKLILCGHHVNLDQLNNAIKDNSNIIYLGPISYEDNLNLEKYSLFSINPRPINPNIDDYSIPSKTLECLSIGALNITVDNKLLKKYYDDCIIWSKSESVFDLKQAIKKTLSLPKEEKDLIIKNGKEKSLSRTSLEVVGRKIKELII